MFILPFFAVIVAVVVVIAQNTRKKNAERAMQWRHWAHARDWLFHENWPQIVGRFRHGPFGRGSRRRATWGFEGTFNGVPAIGFQYQYTVQSGDNSATHRHTILAVRITNAHFPHLALTQRSWGRRGVTFENAHFNKIWQVTANSNRFAHDFFNPRCMELFLMPHPPFRVMWIEGDHLLLQLDAYLPPEEVDARLMMLTRILSLQPDFMFREVGAQPPQITHNGPGVPLEEQHRRIWALRKHELGHYS